MTLPEDGFFEAETYVGVIQIFYENLTQVFFKIKVHLVGVKTLNV